MNISKQYACRPAENYRDNNPLLPQNLRGLVIGKSGCGKTTVIFDLLLQPDWFAYNYLERYDRKCVICKDDVEDENHFIMNCPLYSNQRFPLNRLFKNNRFFQLCNDDQKFIFIMTNENEDVMVELAKFIFSATIIREEAIKEA